MATGDAVWITSVALLFVWCVRDANDVVGWTFSIARRTQPGLALIVFRCFKRQNGGSLFEKTARKPLQRRTWGHFHEFSKQRTVPTACDWLVSSRVTPKRLVDVAGRAWKVRRTYLILRIPTACGSTLVSANVDSKESTRGTESIRDAGRFWKVWRCFLAKDIRSWRED